MADEGLALFNATISNDAYAFAEHFPKDVAQRLPVLSDLWANEGLTGNIVYWASVKSAHQVLEQMVVLGGDAFLEVGAATLVKLTTLLKYAAAEVLLKAAPVLVATPSNGNYVLHVAASRQRPNCAFLRFLASLPNFDPNQVDESGKTALHLIADRSRGAEGRDAARFLVSVKADRAAKDDAGLTPSQCCRNPHAYAALCEAEQPSKRRKLPPLDEDTKSFIETADLSELHPLPPIDVSAVALANDTTLKSSLNHSRAQSADGSTVRGFRKLASDEQDSLVQRLYADSISKKQRWQEAEYSKILEKEDARRKKVSGDEIEDAVQRLYTSELEQREERRALTLSKYIKEVPEEEKRLLSLQEVTESVSRQTNEAMNKKAAITRKLTEKYAPEPEEHRLSKEEQAALAVRLHDESRQKSRASMATLVNQYCNPPKGKFAGAKTMTAAEWKAMGERLVKKG